MSWSLRRWRRGDKASFTVIIIGERINSSSEKIARAIEDRDAAFIQREAVAQVDAGADYLDVNAGTFLEKEPAYLAWLVEVVQEAVSQPLCIDSNNPAALSTALTRHKGKAIVNSVSAERRRYDPILPLLKEHGCGVVAMLADDSGIPATVEGRVEMAHRIVSQLTADGIDVDDVFIDPVVRPISVEPGAGAVVLETIERIKGSLPGVRTVCGLSNISFGLPLRRAINRLFVVMAMQRGLDAVILDPCDRQLMANLTVANTLLGRDPYCQNYLAAFRQGKLGSD